MKDSQPLTRRQFIHVAGTGLAVSGLLGQRAQADPAVSSGGAGLAPIVRIDSSAGAPRLMVNGEPVRARMFWGAPGSASLPVSPEWKEVIFEFVAGGNADNGTMHFRFGPTPGEVYLDGIRVADLDGPSDLILRCDFEAGPDGLPRDWTFWPADARNTVGSVRVVPGAGRDGSAALAVKLQSPPQGNWPDFHVYHQPRLAIAQGHRYRVSFWAKSEPGRNLSVALYRPGQPYVRLGGPQDCFSSQIKLAAEAGVDIVSFPIDLPWPAPGEPADWSRVDARCDAVLAANPKALLLPRMGMSPPQWWRRSYPDDVMQWEDGRRDNAVVASPRYRRDAAERLASLVGHLEEKYGERTAGYHPCGQNTGEWFYLDTWKRPLNGYAPADLAAWRQWLKERYGGDAALRRAWNDAEVTCGSATVPTPAARRAALAGVFRDPAVERPLIDWAEFQQQAMADCVCHMAHAVRSASAGRKLVVFFYGYVFEFGAVPNGPATAGHYALRRVLNCPDIDVLCAPISYFDRGLGQGAPSMTAAESVALAGKMWLNEDDTHTYLATGKQPGSQQHVATLQQTNQQLVRNLAQEALRNFGTWWMDLGATGWFNDPGMWAQMKRLRALDEPLLRKPAPFRPEVAAVIDERSMLLVAAGGNLVTRPGIYEAREPLGRLGAPYGQYLLDDVLHGRVPARLYIFLNAWYLSPAERLDLLRATRGAARLWCYAPGYFENHHASLQAMRQLTGFDLKRVSPPSARAAPTEAGRQRGIRQAFGVQQPPQPLFAAADAQGDEVLATYCDGTAAAAMRHTPQGTSLFVGAPAVTSQLLRAAARAAGVHLFTEEDCNVYANGPFLALHASHDGPLAVDVGRAAPVRDALTGADIGLGPRVTLPLKRGETRILRYDGVPD